MRSWSVLCAIALLSASVVACGKAETPEHPAPQPSARTASGKASTSAASPVEGHSRPPQNDDYISTYGREAAPREMRRIKALVERYYAAALAGDGATACSLLYSTLARAVPEDYGAPGRPRSRGTSCAAVLPRLFKRLPGHSGADLASTKVTGARLSGQLGFVQLSSRAMPTGEISIKREGGSWKIGVLAGRACSRCAAG